MKVALTLVAASLMAATAAQAQTYSFGAALNPEVAGATGTGTVLIEYDAGAQTLSIDALWFGLSGTTTVAHIHCCTTVPETGTVGVAVTPGTLPGFPVGVRFGSYDVVLDLTQESTYTTTFRNNNGGTAASAEMALIQGFYDGTAYFNVHSTAFPSGEIRGFIQAVPEPASYALMALGLAAVVGAARRRRA